MITPDHIARGMTYAQYNKLLNDLVAQGKTTGGNQSEEYVHYGKLNVQRMHRLDKTVELIPELKEALAKISESYTWLALTEGWCGDAAQNLPILHAIEKECPNIQLVLLLRDENLDVMDQYLTGSSRSIPKVICLKKETVNNSLEEIFVWGPRPEAAQGMMLDLKNNNASHDERVLTVQKWYNADKTISTQKEFLDLINTL
jgi:thioredoxin family protein